MLCCLTFLSAVPQALALTKKNFDFVVGVDGDFKAAMAAAASKASSSNRFYLFFPDGEYNIGTLTGDANQMTTFTTSNVSFIGQSTDKTIVYNKSSQEGISITSTLYFKGADHLYLQDITFYNKANYGNTSTYNQTGRHVVIKEEGDQIIYKNVKLLSTQDTYYTKGTRTYWENGEIHGTTDFICGSGDVYFNTCKLYALKKSALTAPSSTNNTWGYVFKDCTIDGDVSNYTLGRSWNDAKAVFINTTMKILPTTAGWGDPMNSVPQVFAEYQSKTGSGSLIDLSSRRTTYSKDGTTIQLNPVLSQSQANQYTVQNVLGGNDNWQPQTYTQQLAAPTIRQEGTTITWEDNDKALCWAVFKNGTYLANVTTNYFDASSNANGDQITVRAANEMGGLGPSSNVLKFSQGKQYTITLSVDEGEGTLTPASGLYFENQNLTLTATPDAGWMFDHWSGDLSGNTNPIEISITKDYTISAHFIKDTRTYYSISTTVGLGGSVTQTPEGNSLPEGTSITWAASPIEGWLFNGWSGDHSGTDPTWILASLNSHVTLSASFVPKDLSTYQIEKGTLKDVDIESKNLGYHGEGYVNYSNIAGASVELLVYANEAGATPVTLAYANGSGVARSLSISVNGQTQMESVEFEPTADWTTWKTKELSLSFVQGGNTLSFATTSDQDGPNLDQLVIQQKTTQTLTNAKLSNPYHVLDAQSQTLRIKANRSGIMTVKLYDLDGRLLLSRRVSLNTAKPQADFSLKSVKPGVYLLQYDVDGTGWSGLISTEKQR